MKKCFAVILALIAGLLLTVSPTLAKNQQGSQSYTTTLDACGYFVSSVTPMRSSSYVSQGVTYSSESGTFTGVTNNYGGGPVASLGRVSGTYTETYTTDAAGNVSGTEVFRSKSGTIYQTFSYDPASGYTVEVSAGGNLAFLTSDTNGHCYAGPFPRP